MNRFKFLFQKSGIIIKGGVEMDAEGYNTIHMLHGNDPSLFCKEFLMLLYSEEELLNRSVTGRPGPTKKNVEGYIPSRALSPRKISALRGN